MPKTILIAICAGLLSLVAAMPALNGAPGGLMLFYVASLPIYLTGFAFGVTAGTVATLSGFVAAATLGGVLAIQLLRKGLGHIGADTETVNLVIGLILIAVLFLDRQLNLKGKQELRI